MKSSNSQAEADWRYVSHSQHCACEQQTTENVLTIIPDLVKPAFQVQRRTLTRKDNGIQNLVFFSRVGWPTTVSCAGYLA